MWWKSMIVTTDVNNMEIKLYFNKIRIPEKRKPITWDYNIQTNVPRKKWRPQVCSKARRMYLEKKL